jgi:hypothetical protein
MTSIQQTVRNALRFISSQQQENGSFLSDQKKPITFYTSLILSSPFLGKNDIRQKGTDFLLREKTSNQQLNYWQADSVEYHRTPYPNDIDDTFVAMQALQQGTGLVTEPMLADLVSLLVAQETVPGGPYRTWIIPVADSEWQDVDIVANSNVGAFLQLLGVELPQLQEYFDTVLIEGLQSAYYHDEITILYFLSRAYKGPQIQRIIDRVIAMRQGNGTWHTPLHTAFAISILLQYNYSAQALIGAIQYLVSTEEDGMWQTASLYKESVHNGVPTYSSCKAYVSMCCIDALSVYERALSQTTETTSEEIYFVKRVHEKCTAITKDPLLHQQLLLAIEKLATKDPQHEIALLPYNFARQLMGKNTDTETVENMAVANTLGWIGYSIYDSILDGEEKIVLLPLANTCIKAMIALFRSLAADSGYAVVQRILEGIDSATLWEYVYCKVQDSYDVPDYQAYAVLANKSLGHAISPLLLASDYPEHAACIETFFTHYLIAKQLNDDAHDWHEDLRNGWINSASAGMIRTLQSLDGAVLQEYFWNTHIDYVAAQVTFHAAQARFQIKKVTILKDVTFLEALLIPLEQSADQAVRERNQTRRFLENLRY